MSGNSGPNSIDIEVGLRLRMLRKERGMSQNQLGNAIGVSFLQVRRYELGVYRLSVSMLVRSARVLGVAPAALLPQEDDPAPTTPAVLKLFSTLKGAAELVENFNRVKSVRGRKALIQLLETLADPEKRSLDETNS